MKKSLGAKPLAQPTPVWAVGAYAEDGTPNAMIAAWGGIACSDPASITVSLRPARHTYAGIMKHKAFTISICPAWLAAEADYLGIVSGKKVPNKIERAGLTTVKSDVVNAPYIDDFPLIVECELSESVELGAHIILVGKIIDVKCDEDKITDGNADISKVQPLVYATGASEYHAIGEAVGKGFSIGKKFMKD
jgi:flavin reductase (DIM6/NTAB) family NADH-FMN oxidoreductase RutF